MTIALVFPGQGSQTVGMGLDLFANFPAAKAVIDQVDHTLNIALSSLMFSGSLSDLTQTQNAQPAIMAVGIAALRALESELGYAITDKISYIAGHSLGEYTSLCAGQAITLPETAKLLRARGLAMKKSSESVLGGMAAILGLPDETVRQCTDQASTPTEQVVIANDNCPGQLVISGQINAVKRAMALTEQAGAKRSVLLPVSGAFHSPYMQSAIADMQSVLTNTVIQSPVVPVISNVTALPEVEPTAIRDNLLSQMTGNVRWTETIRYMVARGVDTFIELGNGRVLSGLIRRIEPNCRVISVGDTTSVKTCLELFQ